MAISIFPNSSSGSSGANWTYLARSTSTGSNTVSFTGLSGYKRYLLQISNISTGGTGAYPMIYVNGDLENGFYSSGGSVFQSNGQVRVISGTFSVSEGMYIANNGGNIAHFTGWFVLDNPSPNGGTHLTGQWTGRYSNYEYCYGESVGTYSQTASLSSISFSMQTTIQTNLGITLYGGN